MKKFLLAFILSIAFLLITTDNTSAQGTFSCAPAPICTINNISCDPDYLAPGNLGEDCRSWGYECGQKYLCITPPPTPTPDPTSTNKYDCSPAPFCSPINVDCDSEHQVGSCESKCGSTNNECIESASLSNTCSCGPAPVCAVLDNQCQNNYYCPCSGAYCGQSNIACVRIGLPPPPPGGCIETAIGCIDVETPTGFVEAILNFAIGIAGGITILLIIYGAFLVLTSSGNPEKVQAGKELITNAIIGLLVIIFAVFILEMVGEKILKIFP